MSTFTLYRFYDTDDDLLYVGLTINPGKRMEQHRSDKSWWCDVARISMEQHDDLEALRAAEREAIQTERPKHNIRMNSKDPTRTSAAPASAVIDGLAGRWFHTWRQAGDESEYATRRGDRILEWQGEILERIEDGLYLVETYSWLDGSPNDAKLVAAADMTMWTFYSSNVEMIASLGCRERWRGDDRECEAQACYLTGNLGLGSIGVCDHCAGYYNSVHPIVWTAGIARLGPQTKVPHPLAVEGRMRR